MCKQELEMEMFSEFKGVRRPYCIVCYRDYQAKYRESNRDILNAKQRAKRREYVLNYMNRLGEYLLAHPCVDCGETDPLVLEFDHLDPKIKLCNISDIRKGSWERILAEIDKCQVVCANCHKRRTAKQCKSWRLDFI